MAIELEDGTIIRSLPEEVSHLGEQQEETQIQLDNLEARVTAALAGVLHYKGSVATYSDLPNDAAVGDVYNVIDTGEDYAWTGSEWDLLGSIVDLSQLVDLISTQTITGVKTFSNGLNVGTKTEFREAGNQFTIKVNTSSFNFSHAASSFESTGKSLGRATSKWSDLYLSGTAYIADGINKNSSGYKLVFPDTNAFTADSELLDTASDQTIAGVKTFTNVNISSIRNSSGAERIEVAANVGIMNADLLTNTNNAYDLGRNGVAWRDLYLSRNIIYSVNTSISYNSSNKTLMLTGENGIILNTSNNPIQFNRSISYSSDNTKDIGTATVRTRNIYLAGNLSDGTNSVTVADLAALITYAKGQGWIS